MEPDLMIVSAIVTYVVVLFIIFVCVQCQRLRGGGGIGESRDYEPEWWETTPSHPSRVILHNLDLGVDEEEDTNCHVAQSCLQTLRISREWTSSRRPPPPSRPVKRSSHMISRARAQASREISDDPASMSVPVEVISFPAAARIPAIRIDEPSTSNAASTTLASTSRPRPKPRVEWHFVDDIQIHYVPSTPDPDLDTDSE